MYKIIDTDQIVLGTCYYPEHWDRSLWEEDLSRMQKAGIRVIRIAEFAWNLVEPLENHFDYSFFDGFLDLCDRMRMQVILCTPTATPPAWLTEKYPEVLNADIDGHLYYHDGRRHYNYTSPVYLEKTAIITRKMAERYAKRACVIGWQIDNEMNCEIGEFYAKSDEAAFKKFLMDKYEGSLDKLNDAWGTSFWNQTFTSWEEVHLPRKTTIGTINPHKKLDYIRFISGSVRSFCKLQSDILREYIKKEDFITTNGIFGNLDNHAMTKESLDFMTYDSYPDFGYCLSSYDPSPDAMRDRWWGKNLSEARSLSERFGIMEQQSGPCGWINKMEAPAPRPGQITLWALQSIAHGANFVSFFRWRTCTFGTEMYWHGILDYSGRDNRRLAEITQLGESLKRLDGIGNALYEAQVGIVKDYDNIWDQQIDVWHRRVEEQSMNAIFAACQKSHTPFDFVYADHADAKELYAKYKLLIYPHPVMMTKQIRDLLTEYVSLGGQLIIGCRAAYKDEHGKCVMDKLPGLLRELTAADIPEYSLIAPDAEGVTVCFEEEDRGAEKLRQREGNSDGQHASCDGRSGLCEVQHDGRSGLCEVRHDGRSGLCEVPAAVFTDLLAPIGDGARVIGRYQNDYYEGTPAAISNEFGLGRAYYYGTAFSEEAVLFWLRKCGVISPYEDIIRLPESMELAVRSIRLNQDQLNKNDSDQASDQKSSDQKNSNKKNLNKKFYFVLNYKKEPADIHIGRGMTNILTGASCEGAVTIPGYGAAVFCQSE